MIRMMVCFCSARTTSAQAGAERGEKVFRRAWGGGAAPLPAPKTFRRRSAPAYAGVVRTEQDETIILVIPIIPRHPTCISAKMFLLYFAKAGTRGRWNGAARSNAAGCLVSASATRVPGFF